MAWLGGSALVLWLGIALLIRAGKRVLAIPALIIAFLLTATTAADAVNMHYGYLPQLNDVVGQPTWTQARYDVKTSSVVPPHPPAHSGEVVSVQLSGLQYGFRASPTLVYVPPNYFADSTTRFPVIYMLHGTPGIPVDWFRSAQAARVGDAMAASGKPVILVAPPVSSSWFDDSECVNRPTERIEDFVTQVVVPHIDVMFRTIPNRASRVIAGNSAGGFCALNIGLKHREIFGSIIDMSGYARPTHSGGMAGLFGRNKDLTTFVDANSPPYYVPRLPSLSSERVWLDCGKSDRAAVADANEMSSVLRNKDARVVLTVRPGGHDFNVWRAAIAQSFPWAIG